MPGSNYFVGGYAASTLKNILAEYDVTVIIEDSDFMQGVTGANWKETKALIKELFEDAALAGGFAVSLVNKGSLENGRKYTSGQDVVDQLDQITPTGQNDVDNVIVQTFQTGFQPYLSRTSTTNLAAMKKIVTIVILCSPPSSPGIFTIYLSRFFSRNIATGNISADRFGFSFVKVGNNAQLTPFLDSLDHSPASNWNDMVDVTPYTGFLDNTRRWKILLGGVIIQLGQIDNAQLPPPPVPPFRRAPVLEIAKIERPMGYSSPTVCNLSGGFTVTGWATVTWIGHADRVYILRFNFPNYVLPFGNGNSYPYHDFSIHGAKGANQNQLYSLIYETTRRYSLYVYSEDSFPENQPFFFSCTFDPSRRPDGVYAGHGRSGLNGKFVNLGHMTGSHDKNNGYDLGQTRVVVGIEAYPNRGQFQQADVVQGVKIFDYVLTDAEILSEMASYTPP